MFSFRSRSVSALATAAVAGVLAIGGSALTSAAGAAAAHGHHSTSARHGSHGYKMPAVRGSVLTPASFGAQGGGADDTAALQRFFDAGSPSVTLAIPAGTTYSYSKVLQISNPGTQVVGGGTLVATNEQSSSVWLMANNVTVAGSLTFSVAHTTQRWTAYEQMGLRLGSYSGDQVEGVTVSGSGAAGIYVGGASNFLLSHVTVQNTRADGIHMTGGANNGLVVDPTTVNTGDDGIAVVSYQYDPSICRNITVIGANVHGTTWGRGMSVVGGRSIVYRDFTVTGSDAAGVYVAAEGAPYNTMAPSNITIDHGTLTNTNDDPSVGHGAVLVMSAEANYAPSDVTVSNVSIRNTRSSAPWDFGIVNYAAAVPSHIAFSNISVVGGPQWVYGGNSPASAFSTANVNANGRALPNQA